MAVDMVYDDNGSPLGDMSGVRARLGIATSVEPMAAVAAPGSYPPGLVRAYDTIGSNAAGQPKDGFCYCGYVGPGLSYIIWTSAQWASVPAGAKKLTIAAFASADADILDYEPGNTHDIPSAVAWRTRQLNRGGLGVIYSDRADEAALAAAMPDLKWWAAVPGWNPANGLYRGQHLRSIATQYAQPGPYDVSIFSQAAFWPTPPDPPPIGDELTPEEHAMLVNAATSTPFVLFVYQPPGKGAGIFLSNLMQYRWVPDARTFSDIPLVIHQATGRAPYSWSTTPVDNLDAFGTPADKRTADLIGVPWP